MPKVKEYPFCSVIVLNYFGEKVIENTLNSLLELNFPKDKLEIIVVDNASEDKSQEVLSEIAAKHNIIKLIFSDKNLGFTKGNNIGIRQAKGKYAVLLNNDCVVEKNWLKELVGVAEKDSKIFAVNSKILLYPKYLNLSLVVDSGLIPIFSWISKSSLDRFAAGKIYLPLWRKKTCYQIEVPVDPVRDKDIEIQVLFSIKRKMTWKELSSSELIQIKEQIAEVKNIGIDEEDLAATLKIDTKSKHNLNKAKDKIQNAGIIVFQDGYGRDIGAIVRYSQQYYEYDRGQYNKESEIYAACGAAVLYRRDVLKSLGFLDESFFMYYEDVDICEKARIAGYKTFYCPKAVARHLHAFSSKEWSPLFIYHAEKGRLLHIFYNFPFSVFFLEYSKLFFKIFVNGVHFLFKYRIFLSFFGNKKSSSEESSDYKKRIPYIYALLYFFINFFFLIPKRINLALSRDRKKVHENYQRILKGEWYTK